MEKLAPKCGGCGRYNVQPEAQMSWNFEEQEWELADWTGFSWCGHCGEDTNWEMVEITKEEWEQICE